MKKILLAGATGHMGRALLTELKQEGYEVHVLVRSKFKEAGLTPAPDKYIYADAAKPDTLAGICRGIDIVISAIGKSISLTDNSSESFQEIDYQANYNLLQEAKAAGVAQFMYISAFTAEEHPDLAYFKAHADFSEALIQSGLNYAVLQPTALFSVFKEMKVMAQKKMLGVIGKGDKQTNPVSERDVAITAVANIGSNSVVVAIGGQHVYTRHELARLVAHAAGYGGKVMHVPEVLVKAFLPLVRPINKNLFDKLAFMAEVSTRHCVAPRLGNDSLEAYLQDPLTNSTTANT